MGPVEGGFVWYELMTSDADAAAAFYADVVGWRMADAGLPGVAYTLAHAGERRVAGLMPTPAGLTMPPRWTGYVLVADVDAMVGRLQDAGGAIHRPPADIPGVGRFAAVADPQGAAFSLFQPNGEAEPGAAPATVGTIDWHELHTSDWSAALAFYGGLFGWEASYAHDMGPMGTYQTFSVGGAWMGGMMNAPSPPAWQFYIGVEDVDLAAERVATAGGSILRGPHDVPGGKRVLIGRDPQGAAFALTGPG